MDELVKMHLDMLINSDVDDKTAREVCYLRITTINEIMAHLQSIADQEKIDKNVGKFKGIKQWHYLLNQTWMKLWKGSI